MTDIQRIAGKISHRCWGSAFKDLVFAVGMTDDFSIPFREQAERSFKHLDRILSEAGTDKSRILSATVLLADIDNKGEFDEMWAEWIGADPQSWPQRSCHGVDFAADNQVEILAVAAR